MPAARREIVHCRGKVETRENFAGASLFAQSKIAKIRTMNADFLQTTMPLDNVANNDNQRAHARFSSINYPPSTRALPLHQISLADQSSN